MFEGAQVKILEGAHLSQNVRGGTFEDLSKFNGWVCQKKGRNHDHFPALRQKRVLHQSNVPPQRAMCPLPWEPWEEDYTTGPTMLNAHAGYRSLKGPIVQNSWLPCNFFAIHALCQVKKFGTFTYSAPLAL